MDGLANRVVASEGEGEEMPARTIKDVLKQHTKDLMAINFDTYVTQIKAKADILNTVTELENPKTKRV